MDKDTITINLSNLQSISNALTAAQGNILSASNEVAHSMKALVHAADLGCESLCLEQVRYAVQLMEYIPYEKIMSDLRIMEQVLIREIQPKEVAK